MNGFPPESPGSYAFVAIAKRLGVSADDLEALASGAAVIVPVEPTKEMVMAGEIALDDQLDSTFGSDADGNMHESTYIRSGAQSEVYRAMIAARPKAEGAQ